ncbi:unnamed protein product [Musa hybrid cultivar]
MYMSHLKVNPKEVTVGWFSTGFGVSGGSALIHDFYVKELKEAVKEFKDTQNILPPIHLTVDTGLRNGQASIKAYILVNLSLGDRPLAAQFQEIHLDLKMIEAERVGSDVLKTTVTDKLPNDLEGMEASTKRLYAPIDDIFKYVDDVVEGRAAPDNDIGRFLANEFGFRSENFCN